MISLRKSICPLLPLNLVKDFLTEVTLLAELALRFMVNRVMRIGASCQSRVHIVHEASSMKVVPGSRARMCLRVIWNRYYQTDKARLGLALLRD